MADFGQWETNQEALLHWKGTDACMDLHCPKCGYHNHYDGFACHAVQCAECKAVYEMSCHVRFKPVDEKTDPYWREHPRTCEYEPTDDVSPDSAKGAEKP